jgi:hypothetical protein
MLLKDDKVSPYLFFDVDPQKGQYPVHSIEGKENHIEKRDTLKGAIWSFWRLQTRNHACYSLFIW